MTKTTPPEVITLYCKNDPTAIQTNPPKVNVIKDHKTFIIVYELSVGFNFYFLPNFYEFDKVWLERSHPKLAVSKFKAVTSGK
jgi:hypothetical protein